MLNQTIAVYAQYFDMKSKYWIKQLKILKMVTLGRQGQPEGQEAIQCRGIKRMLDFA